MEIKCWKCGGQGFLVRPIDLSLFKCVPCKGTGKVPQIDVEMKEPTPAGDSQ